MLKDRATYTLLFILLLGFALSYLLYSGPYLYFDDTSYILSAHQILSGSYHVGHSPYALRYLLIASLVASFSLLGQNVVASFLPGLIEYTAMIVFIFLTARLLYGERTGIIATFLSATAPFVVGYTTRVLPDMLLGLLTTLSIYLLVKASKTKNNSLYFISGAFAALTIYVKLEGIAFVLFFLIGALALGVFEKRNKRKKYLLGEKNRIWVDSHTITYILAGILLIFLINLLITYLITGSPIYLFLINSFRFQTIIPVSSLKQNLLTFLLMTLGYLTSSSSGSGSIAIPTSLYKDPQIFPLGLIIIWAFIGTLAGIKRRERNITYFSLLLWGTLTYLFFGTGSLATYFFINVVSRYFILISLPMAIVGAYGISIFYEPLEHANNRTKLYLFILILLLITFIFNIPIYLGLYDFNRVVSGNTAELYNVLSYANSQNHSNNVIFTNQNATAEFLGFLSNFKYTTVSNNDNVCQRNYSGSFLLIATQNGTLEQKLKNSSFWSGSQCKLIPLHAFYNLQARNNTFSYYGIDSELYLITNAT